MNFFLNVISRSFHSSCLLSSLNKQAKVMNKLLGNPKTSRKKFLIFNESKNVRVVDEIAHKATKRGSSRRQTVLNKLFMKNITDLMATGHLSFDFIQNEVEISQISVSPDYKMVNIYYIAKKPIPDIENQLKEASFSLRHELSQLKLMGEVPRVEFIKDKKHNKTADLDQILSTIDLKSDYNEDEDGLQEEEVEKKDLPPMENKVYGLDHTRIMDKVRAGLKKSYAAHRRDMEPPRPEFPEEKPSSDEHLSLNSKSLISKFIKSRKNT